MRWRTAALMSLGFPGAVLSQEPCVRLNSPYWQVGASRLFQSSGSGQRVSGVVIERHFVDRRALRRSRGGYLLEIRRTRLGLRDETVDVAVEYAANGAVIRITGDTAALQHEVSPLPMLKCSELQSGATYPDLGGRADTLRTQVQQSITRSVPARAVTVGAAIDTLGTRLVALSAKRTVTDTSRGEMQRRMPNGVVDTVTPWTMLGGEEVERQLVRASDGAVLFRERTRSLKGRGWVPPHDITDTVPIRVETASIERVVDSVTAAGILGFPRRGEMLVSATARDTVALHYREWRGDTLVLRQVRRSGWRDELRTVWRDSVLVSASLLEPGTASQQPGPFWRPFRVQGGYLYDSGAKDSSAATPTHPWAIALDGFEDAIVPALMAVPVDGQPHRFSMYGVLNDQGAWLDWSVTIVPRGTVRLARFYNLKKQWVGSFVFTPTGELLLSTLGGAAGVARLPAVGTRLAALLDVGRANITREDLIPNAPASPAPLPQPR